MKGFNGKIIQVLPTLSFGDGVSNDALAMDAALKRHGYQTALYAESIDKRLPKGTASYVRDMPWFRKKDVILYHLSTGSRLNATLPHLEGRKVVVYHNITPHTFLEEYSPLFGRLCRDGRKDLLDLKDVPEHCFADSEFNKQELLEAGYHCPIDVLPILIPFEDYRRTPSEKVRGRYAGDGYTNLLFTGRIVPNKKQEDIIAAFCAYQKHYNPKSRLFLVGSYDGMEAYYGRLKAYAEALGARNVVFTGHIPFDEILAYYTLADFFLCLSEHEGFCIPLVEAMLFEVPIIAYQSTGVTGTMGEGGFPLKEKKPLEVAGLIHYLTTHPGLRQELVRRGQERLQSFRPQKVEERFIRCLEEFL